MPERRISTLGTPITEIKAFVINLKTREDRRVHALKESERNGMTVTFVDAVPSESIESSELGFLTSPALACWKSHILTLEFVVESREQTCLVLEDDFEFNDFQRLSRVLKKVEAEDWDIIQVGFLTHDFKEWVSIKLQNIESIFFNMVARLSIKVWPVDAGLNKKLRIRRAHNVPLAFVPDDLRAGAHAYIINKSCARIILSEHSGQRVLTADGLLIATNWTRPFKTLRLRKSLVGQMISESSIKGRQ